VTAFAPFPKLTRLSRDMVVTEKLDGTNAQITVVPLYEKDPDPGPQAVVVTVPGVQTWAVFAGSRNRWITPDADNFGFARWVWEHARELANSLGEGSHFGEWWGKGIQRTYDLDEKRFSLFNTGRWNSAQNAADSASNDSRCFEAPLCHVVPVVVRYLFDTNMVDGALERLRMEGSMAAPGFKRPEGVVVYHVPSGVLFKKTLGNDGHKGAA
jgi:hypothetical protein